MSRRLNCPQCGAPHRLHSVETRFRCDYCRSWIELSPQTNFEIWQLGVPAPAADVHTAVSRWLQEQELAATNVQVGAPRWASHWQIFSDAGEEFRAETSRWSHPLLAQLSLPGAARIDASEVLPEPRTSRSDAEQAALASFRDADATLHQVRLVHQSLTPIVLQFGLTPVDALFQAADERLIVAPLPEFVRRIGSDRRALIAYVAFMLLCLIVGLSTADPLRRFGLLALLLVAGSLSWPFLQRALRP